MKTAHRTSALILAAALALSCAPPARSGGAFCALPDFVAGEKPIQPETIRAYRDLGGASIIAMNAAFKDELAAIRKNPQQLTPRQEKIRTFIDGVAAQKDAAFSGLYWFTDFEQARSTAMKEGKPILSLRLLGRLDEELSCANSRYFRTVLYANQELATYLREHFILHWESVRPVPKITVEFGDGRKLERTITGNSVHYVVDHSGRTIDAMPGLYSATAFRAAVEKARAAAVQLTPLKDAQFSTALKEYHTRSLAELELRRSHDFQRAGLQLTSFSSKRQAQGSPDAATAGEITRSKSAVERPLTSAILPGRKVEGIGEQQWQTIASLHLEAAALDENSRALFMSKQAPCQPAARVDKMLTTFQRNVAEDTVRNEYLLRPRIHQWFANGEAPASLAQLNERVYAELFLTPSTDPWLGLAPTDAYSALDRAGLVTR